MGNMGTIIAINIPSSDHTQFKLNYSQSKSHGSWLDWGDGSQKEAFDSEGLIEASHTYAEPGDYDITLFAVDDADIELISLDSDIGYRNMVTQVIIGEDATKVHDSAFSDCENLEELQFLGESTEIGDYAFSNCVSLLSVELPSNIGYIPEGVFFNCSSLRNLDIPETVSVIGLNAFYGCSQLREVALTNVYSVGNYAFHGCRKLSKIELTDTAHDIGDGAFDSCSNARTINIGKVVDIGDRAFCNCRSVSRITVPDTVSVIGDEAFYNCMFLKEIKMEATEPPILKGTKSLPVEGDFKIILPRGGKRNYAYATNWSLYVDKMEEAY